eukprot:TRINITY_DN4741_c0_g1_i1.p2 TRINITY_DN4741_c0_g1~~TRINITY_DN4741_c0_g1_i1.p2  ORF type:complete len:114 (-),score=25.56 TRINITY_DN4741_c0_g1_i1:111-452(-)
MSAMWPATGGHPTAHSPLALVRALPRLGLLDRAPLPPFHVIHGAADTTVPPTQSLAFSDALRAACRDASPGVTYVEGGHYEPVAALFEELPDRPGAPNALDHLLRIIEGGVAP